MHLMVRNLDTSAVWFRNVFGGEITQFKGLPGLPAIRYGDMWLVLSATKQEVVSNHERSVDHIGWKISDMDTLAKKLEAERTTFLVKPRRSGNVIFAFIEGPSGVKIEIQQVLKN